MEGLGGRENIYNYGCCIEWCLYIFRLLSLCTIFICTLGALCMVGLCVLFRMLLRAQCLARTVDIVQCYCKRPGPTGDGTR